MRFDRVAIENFRAIKHFSIEGLSDAVVIAGPNGCGKSAVLDAIRLLKSVYGGYQANEWHTWFGEFQINISRQDGTEIARLFRDSGKPIVIAATVTLSEDEREYVSENAEALLLPIVWSQVTGRPADSRLVSVSAPASDLRRYNAQVQAQLSEEAARIRSSLSETGGSFQLMLMMDAPANLKTEHCPVMELIFQTYRPEHLGVIDYHSAARSYQREAVGGVNLNLESKEEERKNQALYNWQSKYRNVKTELASQYVREILAREAGVQLPGSDLNDTLQELFQTFFPDKSYNGPIPNAGGGLDFPVQLSSGESHDIDELSSGEKEVLYGYLRLRNSAPTNSVVLLDEPELHLNPGLLQGLPDFYHRHIGRALNNQLWLITHSDTLLRQAVGNPNFTVFHMRSAITLSDGANQASRVVAESELERAVIDLVGDLATYKPHGKVVILEGGGDSKFDELVVGRLFPEFAQRVNLVSGGGRGRVAYLHEFLGAASGTIGAGIYAIVDRDWNTDLNQSAFLYQWDKYHIENYFLDPNFVLRAIQAIDHRNVLTTPGQVLEALKECAAETVNRLVYERLQSEINDKVVRALNIRSNPGTTAIAQSLIPSIVASFERLDALRGEVMDERTQTDRENTIRSDLTAALNDGRWRDEFPGRSILTRFVDTRVSGVNYEAFRNLILNQMVDVGHKPEGMARVIEAIDSHVV